MNGIIAGVGEIERARDGVAVLMNYVWHCAMTEFGCVTSRTLKLGSSFSRVKICVVVVY